ncbi:MAG: hypothetical protein ACTSYU_12140, partial [Promethearchaeota archaeon]
PVAKEIPKPDSKPKAIPQASKPTILERPSIPPIKAIPSPIKLPTSQSNHTDTPPKPSPPVQPSIPPATTQSSPSPGLDFVMPDDIPLDEEALALGEALQFEPELESLKPIVSSIHPLKVTQPDQKKIPDLPPIPTPPKKSSQVAPSEIDSTNASKFKFHPKENVVKPSVHVKSLTDIAIETIPEAEKKFSSISESNLQIPKVPRRNSPSTSSNHQPFNSHNDIQSVSSTKSPFAPASDQIIFQDDGFDDDDFTIPSIPKRKSLQIPKIKEPTEKPQADDIPDVPSESSTIDEVEILPHPTRELLKPVETSVIQTSILRSIPKIESTEANTEPLDDEGGFESMLFFGVPMANDDAQPSSPGAGLFQVFSSPESTENEKLPTGDIQKSKKKSKSKSRTKKRTKSKKSPKKTEVMATEIDVSPKGPSPALSIPSIPPRATPSSIPTESFQADSIPPIPPRSVSTESDQSPPSRIRTRIRQKRVEFCPMCGKVAQKCTCGYMSSKTD